MESPERKTRFAESEEPNTSWNVAGRSLPSRAKNPAGILQLIEPGGVSALMSDTPHSTDGDLSHLTAADRAAHYRGLVDRHLALAGTTTAPEAQAAHLELAALWTRLAGEADRQAQTPTAQAEDAEGTPTSPP